jgi:electron transfer flavoprotein beta subunit
MPLKIVVCIKQIPDTEARLRVAADGRSLDAGDLKFVMSPYDEFAIEEALRTREAKGGTVTALCLGMDRARLAVRDALAMGADEGVLVKETREHRDGWSTAQVLAAALRELAPDLVFFGRQGGDLDQAQVPARVAELLDLPCLTAAAKVEVGDASVTIQRRIEGGMETVEAPLPVVVSADEFLNEPRYASLKGIMAAKKKTIAEREAGDLADKVTILSMRPRPERKGGRVVGQGVAAVPELVRLLREEAKIL